MLISLILMPATSGKPATPLQEEDIFLDITDYCLDSGGYVWILSGFCLDVLGFSLDTEGFIWIPMDS